MISDSKKFIFIHIPKTAGLSIAEALKEYTNESKMESIHGSHTRVNYWHKQFQRARKPWDYYIFTTVRNSWERILSMVFYKSLNGQNPEECWTSKNGRDCFAGIIKDCVHDRKSHESPQYRSQTWFLDREVTRIMRFDYLQEDFDLVCNEIKVPRRQLPVINASKHKHYREYYTREQKKLVEDACAKEIERFGFKF